MMDFAKSERLGSQDFAAQQADIMRQYQTSERKGSQAFARLERIESQGWSETMQESQNIFQEKLHTAQMTQQQTQFDAQMKQMLDQFEEDQRVNAFNMGMAEKQFNKKGLMDVFTDPIGFGKSFGGSALMEGTLGQNISVAKQGWDKVRSWF
jgi:hypothetical protein